MRTASCRTVTVVQERPEGWDERWLLYRDCDEQGLHTHRYELLWRGLDGAPFVMGWALVIEAQVAEGDHPDFCPCPGCLKIVCGWAREIYAAQRERNCGKEK